MQKPWMKFMPKNLCKMMSEPEDKKVKTLTMQSTQREMQNHLIYSKKRRKLQFPNTIFMKIVIYSWS